MSKFLTKLLLILLVTSTCFAASSEIKQTPKELEKIKANISDQLAKIVPELKDYKIKLTPVNGVFAIIADDGEIFYITADASYVLYGELLDLSQSREKWSLTEVERAILRKKILDLVPLGEMIVYPAIGKAKNYITVLTDIDCQYCRKFHDEIPALNQAGIEVRYMAFPRMGINSDTAKKMGAIWCSKDRKASFELAKKDQFLDFEKVANCLDNPIKNHFETGLKLRVEATPMIFLADGKVVRGFMQAKDLIDIVLAK